MKTRTKLFLILIASVSLISIQLVNANVSTMITSFEKPNAQLEDNKTPDGIGRLNKNYQHEEFKALMQEEISKAEQIRDKIMSTQTRDY